MTTATTSATDAATDPRVTLDRAIATTAAVIAAIRPDQLTAPTPCPEMDVRTLLGHLVGVLDRITALGTGGDALAVTEGPAPDDAWSAAFGSAATRATAAWRDDALLTRPMALPWIQGSGAELLASFFSELTVHTWDLATATGQQPRWDDHVVTAALEARPALPEEDRHALFEQIAAAMGADEVRVPFAEAVPVAADAPAIDRLVAWSGRDPRSA